MNTVEIIKWLEVYDVKESIRHLLEKKMPEYFDGIDISSDIWDIQNWRTNMKNAKRTNVYFEKIKHIDCKLACKVLIIDGRIKRRISSSTMLFQLINAFNALSDVLGARSFTSLKTDDFLDAEKLLVTRYSNPYPFASSLQRASEWLSINFDMRLDYINGLSHTVVKPYGRKGSDAGREKKLITVDLIREILAAKNRPNLSKRDNFFISVFAIAVGTGFRIGELTTLPAQCKLKIDGALHILHFPEKGGKLFPRLVPNKLSSMVEAAIDEIRNFTEPARELARELHSTNGLNWRLILDDEKALRYFIQKWVHEWTSNPDNSMYNNYEIWSPKLKRKVNFLEEYSKAHNNVVLAAKQLGINRQSFSNLLLRQKLAIDGELDSIIRGGKSDGLSRTNWYKNDNFISFAKLERHVGLYLKPPKREQIKDIIKEAQELQLKGLTYPKPASQEKLESQYLHKREPLLKTKEGKVLLYKDDALFLINKGALSKNFIVRGDEYNYLTDQAFSKWLRGSSRANVSETERDSVFNRFGIIDSRSGKIASFTSHDIRHWLNTVYQNGGLTEDQIALIFNRKYKKQNATYDQTTNKVRIERLKKSIRDNLVIGQISDSYHRIAEDSREESEEYLLAAVRMVNPMPHGVCMLSWASTPCPHHMSCFSCNDEKPCEHLIVDPSDEGVKSELNRLKRVADLTVDAIESQSDEISPTVIHFKRISRNISMTLETSNSKHERS